MKINEVTTSRGLIAFANKIKKECGPAIKLFTEDGGIFYRGSYSGPHKKGEPMYANTDRHPKDTDTDHHNIIDKWMGKNLRFQGRSKGLFVTGSTRRAEIYGIVYGIFPRGNLMLIGRQTY